MKNRRGLTFIEVLIGIISVIILAAVLLPTLLESKIRSKITSVKSDLRSLATAIEAYKVDHKQYPASVSGAASVNGSLPIPISQKRMTFATLALAPENPQFATLTTPTPYIATIPTDLFARQGAVYGYINAVDAGWMIWSYGPDCMQANGQLDAYFNVMANWDEEEEWKGQRVYNPFASSPSPELLTGSGPNGALNFDSTNGITSTGDIWQIMGGGG